MNIEKLLHQFKTLAEKHLGDPPDPNAPPVDDQDSQQTNEDGFDSQSKARVRSVIQDFQSITPLIEQAGYTITDLQIELGIIPKLIPHFLKVKDVDAAEKEAILDSMNNKRLMKMLMHALFKADSFQQNLKMNNYKFKGIEIEIAPIPAVRLNYSHLNLTEKSSQELTTNS